MDSITELENNLKIYFKWNKARIACFVGILIGLLKGANINLTQIALFFPATTKLESRYRRIQRFIHQMTINNESVAILIMALFKFNNTQYYITIDRTNWQCGSHPINIFF